MELSEDDPRHHTLEVRRRLQETIEFLRVGAERVKEPRARTLFETSAEVLGGLVKAFSDYEQKFEDAWRA
jgi:hypothetical protein